MTPPFHGLAGIQAAFGRMVLGPDPQGGYRIESPIGWEAAHMTLIREGELPGLPLRRLYVNRVIREPLIDALSMWQAICPEYRIKTIGCWSVRYKRTAAKQVSAHAYGLAVDVNAANNPLADKLITDMPDEFIACWKEVGWIWGGDFSGKKDPMHWQWVDGY